MSADFDVIVVGGGPSGALAAYGAANAGLKVLILEKSVVSKSKTLCWRANYQKPESFAVLSSSGDPSCIHRHFIRF